MNKKVIPNKKKELGADWIECKQTGEQRNDKTRGLVVSYLQFVEDLCTVWSNIKLFQNGFFLHSIQTF